MKASSPVAVWRNWMRWLQTPLGKNVLAHEQENLQSLKGQVSGDHVLWVGVPSLSSFPDWYPHQSFFICPDPMLSLTFTGVSRIQGDYSALPFLPESIDIAILPHTLEFSPEAEQLLQEVYTVLNPHGYVIIFGFNPWSLWGIRRFLSFKREFLPLGSIQRVSRIKEWLDILNFEIINEKRSFYRPPINHEKFLTTFRFLELVGRHTMCFFGCLYMVVARKKVFGTTPLRLRWEQWVEIVSKGIGQPAHSEGYYYRN